MSQTSGEITESDDEPLDPQQYVVQNKRARESETPFRKGQKRKAASPERSAHFVKMRAEILRMRPGFSCDWDTTSDAMLGQILAIERDKNANHYAANERPATTQPSPEQENANARILAGIGAIAKELKKINRRVTKLEKGKQ